MRIALLTNFIPPYRRRLYEEIASHCSAFKVFLSAPSEFDREWVPDWGSLSVHLQRSVALRTSRKHPNRFTQPYTVHFPYDTLPQLMRFRPDVIISGELGMRTLQAAVYRRLFPRSKLVIWAKLSEVTEQARGRIRPILRRRLLPRADAIVVNGDSGARYVESMGAHPERVFVVRCMPELKPFLANPPDRPAQLRRRLLYSGLLTELKGVLPFLGHLARWASRNPDQRIDFDLAGTGPLREQIAAFQTPSNLSVRLLGSHQYAEMPRIYREAGILVFPTLSDEWGMVVPEAMASGMPVLGSRFSQAVEELIRPDETGWTFRTTSEAEVDAAIGAALHAPLEMLDTMGRRGRDLVAPQTPAVVAERMMTAVRFAAQAG